MTNKRRRRYAHIASYAELQRERAFLDRRIAQNQYYLDTQGRALSRGIDKSLSLWSLVLAAHRCFRYLRKRQRKNT